MTGAEMTNAHTLEHAESHGLYSARQEHDACGVGFVANIKGRASHGLVQQALLILQNLDHRGAVGADVLCGDGAGILIQIQSSRPPASSSSTFTSGSADSRLARRQPAVPAPTIT